MTRSRCTALMALLGPLAATLPAPAFAAWPDKAIRVVLPVAPAAASDALARSLAAHLATRLGRCAPTLSRDGHEAAGR